MTSPRKGTETGVYTTIRRLSPVGPFEMTSPRKGTENQAIEGKPKCEEKH